MSLADANQILLTRFAFDNARAALRGEDLPDVGTLRWANHGSYLLKGVEEPVEVCEVRAAEGALSPPSTSEKAQRYSSPDADLVLGWRRANIRPNRQAGSRHWQKSVRTSPQTTTHKLNITL